MTMQDLTREETLAALGVGAAALRKRIEDPKDPLSAGQKRGRRFYWTADEVAASKAFAAPVVKTKAAIQAKTTKASASAKAKSAGDVKTAVKGAAQSKASTSKASAKASKPATTASAKAAPTKTRAKTKAGANDAALAEAIAPAAKAAAAQVAAPTPAKSRRPRVRAANKSREKAARTEVKAASKVSAPAKPADASQSVAATPTDAKADARSMDGLLAFSPVSIAPLESFEAAALVQSSLARFWFDLSPFAHFAKAPGAWDMLALCAPLMPHPFRAPTQALAGVAQRAAQETAPSARRPRWVSQLTRSEEDERLTRVRINA